MAKSYLATRLTLPQTSLQTQTSLGDFSALNPISAMLFSFSNKESLIIYSSTVSNIFVVFVCRVVKNFNQSLITTMSEKIYNIK